MSMNIGATAQFFLGASAGLAVVFVALLASTASIRAGEMWAAHNWVRATALASFAGILGFAAVAGMVVGVIWLVVYAPVAS